MSIFSVEVSTSLTDVEPHQWQQVFADDYPFIQYSFLAALELSSCTVADTGWQPLHILVFAEQTLVAAMPCYLKNHSYGEYIFDWSWANAYQQHGLDYYPKLVTAIPFTPASGARVGIHPAFKFQTKQLIKTIVDAITQLQARYHTSNWQCLFVDPDLNNELAQLGAINRNEIQYHWFNRHYQNFDDFLQQLTSRKRKSIGKERARVKALGFSFDWLQGEDIGETDWQTFYRFYQKTYLKRSNHDGYLNLNFFKRLTAALAEQVLLLQVKDNNHRVVANSLFFRSGSHLYGRYWGAEQQYDYLHFESCYYQGIEYCIAHKLQCFDAGAQGEHKLKRGFEPVTTHSNYLLAEGPFKAAIIDFIEQEKNQQQDYLVEAKAQLPYKSKD